MAVKIWWYTPQSGTLLKWEETYAGRGRYGK